MIFSADQRRSDLSIFSKPVYTHRVSIDLLRPAHGELAPEFALMGFLYFADLHGYELHRQLSANLREVWRIPQNQTYNLLKRLEKEGFAQPAGQPIHSTGRMRTPLMLTTAGRARFERWLMTASPCTARALRVELLTRLFFARQIAPELPAQLIQQQLDAIEAALTRLEARRAAIPVEQAYNRASLEIRIRQLNMLQEWLNSNAPSLHT